MQSARSRRERYVGSWLPEQVDTSADPELRAEHGEGLEAGILLLIEKLSPTERAAYILREAFDYPYRDIANVLRLEEANARQVVTRARQHVVHDRRMPASSTEQRHLLGAFIAAARSGDIAGLEGLFASDVISTSDGDGSVRPARVSSCQSRAHRNVASPPIGQQIRWRFGCNLPTCRCVRARHLRGFFAPDDSLRPRRVRKEKVRSSKC